MISFVFNFGEDYLKPEKNSLVRLINAGEDPNTVAKKWLPKWIWAKNEKTKEWEILKGQIIRRKKELDHFCS